MGARERNEVDRLVFKDVVQTLSVERLVVIDESSTPRAMTRRYARAPRGHRAFASAVRNYGRKVSLLAVLRLDGMTAPLVTEGAVTPSLKPTASRCWLRPCDRGLLCYWIICTVI